MIYDQQPPVPNRLKWVERTSYLLDERFRIPGTRFRFGLDPILNLIPFAGDISGLILSAVLVFTMARHGVSRKVVILMTLNILIDFLIGAIPFIGQVFDFFYKANSRNISLLKKHYEEGRYQGSGSGILIGIFVFILVVFTLGIFMLWKLLEWLAGLF